MSQIVPEMRIRFTSPHPKDFPLDLIKLIQNRPNICKFIHMPAQSGSSKVLERMRRGYSREAYLELIQTFREHIPNVAISSDFISGFCGETDQDHEDTISLMKEVRYDNAFMFAYSLREKTHAHRNYKDDVDPEVKKTRLEEIIQNYRKMLGEITQQEVGKRHLILLEGEGRREEGQFFGKTDTFKNVCIPKSGEYKLGDFVEVIIEKVSGVTLIGKPIGLSSVTTF
jgi:tRNA-2-methylthio-N6-dimethylallyladenosine synthase